MINYAKLIEIRGLTALWLAERLSAMAIVCRRRAARDLPIVLEPNDLVTRMRREEGQ
jgi:hypothetical protein